MAFTYHDLWTLRMDEAIKRRVIACAALEGQFQPGQWWETHGWQVVARTDWAAAYTYGITGLPTTFFLSAEGNLVAGRSGAMNYDILMSGIDLINP